MKKYMFSSLALVMSMMTTSAFATNDPDAGKLTTKGYVDDGLRAVYRVATGQDSGAVSTLQQTVGTKGNGTTTQSTGLVGDVEELQQTVEDLGENVDELSETVQNLQSSNKTYTAGKGVAIDANNNNAIGLDVTTSANKAYVFKTNAQNEGTWQELETVTADDWNASIFAQ